MIEKPEKLAEDHWSYVEQVLRNSGESPEVIEKIKFHYISAMIHGIKHGRELYGREMNGENIHDKSVYIEEV